MSKKFRILLVCQPHNPLGSPHYQMAGMHLRKFGYLVNEVHIKGKSLANRISFFLRALLLIYKELAKDKNTVLYIEGAPQSPALFFFRGVSCPIVYHTQDYLEPGQKLNIRIWRFFERSAARRASLVVSNEINRARFMTSDYGLKQIPLVVRTALPSDWPVPEPDEDSIASKRRNLGLPSNCRILAAGGGFGEDRMSPQVVQALALLPDDVVIVFTGKNTDAIRHSLAFEMIESGRLLFLEKMDYCNLLELYSICDAGLLLYPSSCIGHFYQAPGRLTEYLRAGIPIVTCEYPSLELLCYKYKIGRACDPYDPVSIADAILIVLDRNQYPREFIRNVATTSLAYEHDGNQLLDKLAVLNA